MASRFTAIATTVLLAGTAGTSLYVASTAQQARDAISAAHDPTTAHGEFAVRADAGGADVTALVAVSPGTPGQVLTVSDAGLPHWAAGGGVAPTAYTAADFTATQGHASTAASIVSGRLRLTIDAAERRYGTVSGAWTTTAPRGVLTLPPEAREVIVLAGVHSESDSGSGEIAVTVALRGGSTTDPSDVDNNAFQAGARLPGALNFDTSAGIYGGELRADTYPGALSPLISTTAWNTATPSPRFGVRWTRGGLGYVAMAAAGTTPDDVMGLAPAAVSPDWPYPVQVVIALQQYAGVPPLASTVDLDVFVWVWL